MIPGAEMTVAGVINPAPNSICGNNMGLVRVAGGVSTTICSELLAYIISKAKTSSSLSKRNT
jgi:xanthine/uracil permease